jgi:hypothetical protein
MNMDLLSFAALHASCKRLNANENIEKAITSYYAAQATGKDFKEWIKQWQETIEETGNDMDAFVNRYGGKEGKGF